MKPVSGDANVAPPTNTSKMADNNEFSDNCIFRRADRRLEEQLMGTSSTTTTATTMKTAAAIKSQQPQQQHLSLDKELSLLLARRRLLQLQSLLENSTKSLHNIWLQADEMVAIDSFDMLRDESRSIEAKLADRFARQYATKCAVSNNLQLVQCDSCPQLTHEEQQTDSSSCRRRTECVQRLASCIETCPKLVSWLNVIGLPDAVIRVILEHTNSSLEKLLSLDRQTLSDVMRQRGGATDAEVERLLGACDRLATLIYKHCPEESRTFPLFFPLCSSSSSSSSTAASPLTTAATIAHHNNGRRIPSESDLDSIAAGGGGSRNNYAYLSHCSMPVGPSESSSKQQQALFWDSWKQFVQQYQNHNQQQQSKSASTTDNESSSQDQPIMLMMDEFETSVSSLNNTNNSGNVANAILQRHNAATDTSTSSAFSSSSSPSLSSIPTAVAAASPPPSYTIVSNNNTIHYVRTNELNSTADDSFGSTLPNSGAIPPPPPPISALPSTSNRNSAEIQQYPVDSSRNSNQQEQQPRCSARNSNQQTDHAPVRSTKFVNNRISGIIPPPPPPMLMQVNPEAYQAHRASYSHIEDDLSSVMAVGGSSSSSAVQKSRSHDERLATAISDGNIAAVNPALDKSSNNISQNTRYRLYSTGAISSSDNAGHHHQQQLHSASSAASGQTNNPSDGESESLGMLPETYQARSMKHHIPHSFVFYCKPGATCSYCQRSFFIGQKCKHCKAKFHKDCAIKAPQTCGMTDELVASLQREFANMTVMAGSGNTSNNNDDSAFLSNSPLLDRTVVPGGSSSSSSSYNIASATSAYCTTALRKGAGRFRSRTQRAFSPFQIIAAAQAGAAAAAAGTVDSSSASSCNSSAPASPAVIITPAAVDGGVKQFRFSAHDEEDEDDENNNDFEAKSNIANEASAANAAAHANTARRPSSTQHEQVGPTPSNPSFNELVDTNMSSESDKTITQAPQDQQSSFFFSNPSRDYHLLSVTSPDLSSDLNSASANVLLMPGSNEVIDENEEDDNEEQQQQQPEQADQFDSEYFLTRASVARQNSFAIRDLNIPFAQLKFRELVGIGTYGIVYRGYWHGDVAIKILNGKPTTPPTPTYDENGECIVNLEAEENHHQIREQFKHELATLRKTRHDNLVLFMGACMAPQHVIVTSFCNGPTLHALVHHQQPYPHNNTHHSKRSSHKSHFSAGTVGGINRAILLAAQVCQGMDYLHHRGFVHRNLKSRNIFLANDKIIITDYGTFSVARMLAPLPPLAPLTMANASGDSSGNDPQLPEKAKSASIYPKEWLYYLAPELCRQLNPPEQNAEEIVLPFSIQSDVYAFGTIWFELIGGEYPLLWTQQSAEAIIEQVGSGIQHVSSGNFDSNLGASPVPPLPTPFNEQRELLELLNACWAHAPEMRPEFRELLKTLARIPQKPLSRSPSHPVHATSRT